MAQEVDKLMVHWATFRARGHSLVQDTGVGHLHHAMVASLLLLLHLEKTVSIYQSEGSFQHTEPGYIKEQGSCMGNEAFISESTG